MKHQHHHQNLCWRTNAWFSQMKKMKMTVMMRLSLCIMCNHLDEKSTKELDNAWLPINCRCIPKQRRPEEYYEVRGLNDNPLQSRHHIHQSYWRANWIWYCLVPSKRYCRYPIGSKNTRQHLTALNQISSFCRIGCPRIPDSTTKIIIRALYNSMFWFNLTPHKVVHHMALSVQEQRHWHQSWCKQTLKSWFWVVWADTHEAHDNSMDPRKIGEISQNPKGNEQRGKYFYSLVLDIDQKVQVHCPPNDWWSNKQDTQAICYEDSPRTNLATEFNAIYGKGTDQYRILPKRPRDFHILYIQHMADLYHMAMTYLVKKVLMLSG